MLEDYREFKVVEVHVRIVYSPLAPVCAYWSIGFFFALLAGFFASASLPN